MKVIIDIESNALVNPTEIWLIVCKDISTGEYFIFRNVTSNDKERHRFNTFANGVSEWIGHNLLGYDWPVLVELLALPEPAKPGESHIDTLILSKLIDYPRKGHSIESYGADFGIDKGNFHLWKDKELYNPESKLFKELETYCVRDVDITHKVYLKYLKYITCKDNLGNTLVNNSSMVNNLSGTLSIPLGIPRYIPSVLLEHRFYYYVVNSLSTNGFKFNVSKAQGLLKGITADLLTLDREIEKAFPVRIKLIKEIQPKVTKHGTLSKTDFRWLTTRDGRCDLSDFNGGPFCRISYESFNPSSHKQIVQVLSDSGWMPTDRTATHIDTEREINRLKYQKGLSTAQKELALADAYAKLKILEKTGWKVNETNLATLPDTAPAAAHSLAKRILLESRRRTLTEWLGLVDPGGRIHGKFYGIGAWTHRMAHQAPNTANIPNEFDTEGKVKLLGKEMRQLWCAPKNRLLVGVDAEGIQLRIFAHYINDKEFTDALVRGKKSDKTDPHSLNQRILGPVCKSRQAAKRFVYALLLGGGIGKLSQILVCSESETKEALDRLLARYTGFKFLKETIMPKDAKAGWFQGLDGRKVRIPGETSGERKHLCMSGYLQNGEAVVMKAATLKWMEDLENDAKINSLLGSNRLSRSTRSSIVIPGSSSETAPGTSEVSSSTRKVLGPIETGQIKLVNFVHDEWQTEVPNNMELAIRVAQIQCKALEYVGQELKLNCPLAGSYYNEDHKDYTIGTNWYTTH